MYIQPVVGILNSVEGILAQLTVPFKGNITLIQIFCALIKQLLLEFAIYHVKGSVQW